MSGAPPEPAWREGSGLGLELRRGPALVPGKGGLGTLFFSGPSPGTQRTGSAEYENNGFIFANEFGHPLHGENLARRNFQRILAAAELGPFRVYDLRHTCTTLLLLKGENAKVVSERLGHAKITLTLDTYSHVLPDMQEAAAEKMEAMFGAGR